MNDGKLTDNLHLLEPAGSHDTDPFASQDSPQVAEDVDPRQLERYDLAGQVEEWQERCNDLAEELAQYRNKLGRKEHIYQDCRHLAARRLSEANDLRRKLAEWKDTAEQWKLNAEINREHYDDGREELAAAEARERACIRSLDKLYTLAHGLGPDSEILGVADEAFYEAQRARARGNTDALDAALEQARREATAPYKAAFDNANLHTDKLPDKDVDRFALLRDEVFELRDTLFEQHEHPPEWELAQIAGIAINWLRAIGKMPPARRDIAKELEQAHTEERERWYTFISALKVDTAGERSLQQDILKAIRTAQP